MDKGIWKLMDIVEIKGKPATKPYLYAVTKGGRTRLYRTSWKHEVNGNVVLR